MSSSVWPSSPLAAASRAFDLLTCAPAPLAFDGRAFPGLPERMMPLDELRKILLARSTSVAVRDAVWRELVIRARRDGPAWVVAAVGMAIPGLRRTGGLLAAGWRGDTADLDGELIVGFVERLRTVDIDVPRICGRLIDAGLRSARKVREAYSDTELIKVDSAGSGLPMLPFDHPDLVLARAVAVAVIDPEEANLIGATRLGDATLAQAAAELGIDPALAASWRRRAEKRLAEAIHAGELDYVTIRPRRKRGRSAPVGSLLGSRNGDGVVLGTQQQPLVGKTSVRSWAAVGAPGSRVRPA
jgi:hypothetical protein